MPSPFISIKSRNKEWPLIIRTCQILEIQISETREDVKGENPYSTSAISKGVVGKKDSHCLRIKNKHTNVFEYIAGGSKYDMICLQDNLFHAIKTQEKTGKHIEFFCWVT